MEKDFDAWNEKKKEIHGKGESRYYRAREVWWCSLGVNVGFEQDGTGNNGERPVLILKAFSRQVCLVLPLTSSTKENAYHVALGEIEGRQAFAIMSQLRLIDTRRLINRIHIVDEQLFEEVRKTAKEIL